MGADYKEIDGGVYDNPNVSIREALNNIVEDLRENPFDNDAGPEVSCLPSKDCFISASTCSVSSPRSIISSPRMSVSGKPLTI